MENASGGCNRNSALVRPQKNNVATESGKKKCHTLKAQVVVDQTSGQIICTAYGTGRVHDFRLFKSSQVIFANSQICLADKGYQGITKLHTLSCTPAKKPRGADLPPAERQYNRLERKLACCGRAYQSKTENFSHSS